MITCIKMFWGLLVVSKIKFDAKMGIETPRSTESLSYGSKGNVSPIDCDVSCVTNVATIWKKDLKTLYRNSLYWIYQNYQNQKISCMYGSPSFDILHEAFSLLSVFCAPSPSLIRLIPSSASLISSKISTFKFRTTSFKLPYSPGDMIPFCSKKSSTSTTFSMACSLGVVR